MGRGDSDGSAVLHGRPVKRRRDPALRLGVRLGVNGKQVLFPRHPEHGQLISAQQVLAPVAQALLTLGPYDYHDSRARGVSRYLLWRLHPGLENINSHPTLRVRLRQIAARRQPVQHRVELNEAEWRSVHRALALAYARDSIEPPRDQVAALMKDLFAVDPDQLDTAVDCVSCGRTVTSDDASLTADGWVGEVCCLGREPWIEAEAYRRQRP